MNSSSSYLELQVAKAMSRTQHNGLSPLGSYASSPKATMSKIIITKDQALKQLLTEFPDTQDLAQQVFKRSTVEGKTSYTGKEMNRFRTIIQKISCNKSGKKSPTRSPLQHVSPAKERSLTNNPSLKLVVDPFSNKRGSKNNMYADKIMSPIGTPVQSGFKNSAARLEKSPLMMSPQEASMVLNHQPLPNFSDSTKNKPSTFKQTRQARPGSLGVDGWRLPDDSHILHLNKSSLDYHQDRMWGAMMKDDVKKHHQEQYMKEDQRKMRQKEMAAAWRSQMAIKDVQEKLVSNNSMQQDQEAMRIRDAAELRAQYQKQKYSTSLHQNSGSNIKLAVGQKGTAKREMSQRKAPILWTDTITEGVLKKENGLAAAQREKLVQQKDLLDKHLQEKRRRAPLDDLMVHYAEDKTRDGAMKGIETARNFNLSPHEYQKMVWQKSTLPIMPHMPHTTQNSFKMSRGHLDELLDNEYSSSRKTKVYGMDQTKTMRENHHAGYVADKMQQLSPRKNAPNWSHQNTEDHSKKLHDITEARIAGSKNFTHHVQSANQRLIMDHHDAMKKVHQNNRELEAQLLAKAQAKDKETLDQQFDQARRKRQLERNCVQEQLMNKQAASITANRQAIANEARINLRRAGRHASSIVQDLARPSADMYRTIQNDTLKK